MINSQDRQILQLALPSIISNITVPLLGMIDVAIVGHMGSAVYIGAVAVGSMIFNLVYWLFGFLRMGASGMTAQAFGRRDLTEVTMLLSRSLAIALGIAFLLIILQIPLKGLMFWLIGPTADVVPFASTYFDIVIWGGSRLTVFICPLRLVYRHAKHPYPDDGEHHTEHCQHSGIIDFSLWSQDED